MPRVYGFAPVETAQSRVLILGTMPGRESLRLGQYYAHPRNLFWQIMADLLGFDASLPYAGRIQGLKSADIALWDVLKTCRREGSMDSKIDVSTAVPNDFNAFFTGHRIERVCFNGGQAETLYRRLVQPRLERIGTRFEFLRLPSTSPANTTIPLADKLKAWEAVVMGRPPGTA